MDRHLFHQANWLYNSIQNAENAGKELHGLKAKIVEILKGHTEIPEEEIYAFRNQVDKLGKYLDVYIEEKYKQMESLKED
jgi:hypothetical protein